jgi:hypothetical protein
MCIPKRDEVKNRRPLKDFADRITKIFQYRQYLINRNMTAVTRVLTKHKALNCAPLYYVSRRGNANSNLDINLVPYFHQPHQLSIR